MASAPTRAAAMMSWERVRPHTLMRVRLCKTKASVIITVTVGIRSIGAARAKVHSSRIHLGARLLVVRDHAGEDHDRSNHGQLNDDEGDGTPVDLAGGNTRDELAGDAITVIVAGRHRAQVEQCKAKWRVYKGSLHVDGKQNTEPDKVNTQGIGCGGQQWHDDEGEFEEVDRKST